MVNQTIECIRESMLSLLEEKEYSKIQMKEIAERAHVGRKTLYRYFDCKEKIVKYIAESLMDCFAGEIHKRNGEELTLKGVTHAFFGFINDNREEFKILKKARLLSYIEDNLFELISQVASKTKFKGMTADEVQEMQKSQKPEDKYALYYTLAGYWCVAMAWMDGNDSLTPDEIAEIAVKIMTGQV